MSIEKIDPQDVAILALARRTGWPDDLRVLLERYPREQWGGHANLGGMAQFWLSRHAMFRELGGRIEAVMTGFRAGELSAVEFPRQLVPRLQFMLEQLNGHHQIEDQHYFPIFRAADDRLARGFDVLDGDHHHIHGDMAATAEAANVMLATINSSDGDALSRSCDAYADASGLLIKGLLRHLDDEEDLIVPLILDRGEEALGVAH